MYVPFLSTRSTNEKAARKLSRRRGGGGGGRGGGSSGGSGGGKSSGSSGSSGGGGRSTPVSTGGSSRSATAFGNGGGRAVTIPSGQLFSGRSEGGGTRNQVFGSSTYGSGYPGITGRGVAGRGFPFFFWPIAWGGVVGAGGAAYLHDTEYGRPDNTSRPGGPIMTSTFTSSSSNTTFHVISDNSTVVELISDITANCSSSLNMSSTSTTPIPYNDTDPNSPQPESAIEYYRASSVALTLDGYNNTAALGNDSSAPDTPLPSNIDNTLLDCLNQTIGAAAPLIDGAGVQWSVSNVGVLALMLVVWHAVSDFVI